MAKRILLFTIYLSAAFSLFWPMTMVAMNTAFAGADGNSPLYVFLFATHLLTLIVLAIGASAFLTGIAITPLVSVGGPLIACFLLTFLGSTLFREAEQRWIFLAPSLALSLAALFSSLPSVLKSKGA